MILCDPFFDTSEVYFKQSMSHNDSSNLWQPVCSLQYTQIYWFYDKVLKKNTGSLCFPAAKFCQHQIHHPAIAFGTVRLGIGLEIGVIDLV